MISLSEIYLRRNECKILMRATRAYATDVTDREPRDERAARAAYLLREALALLASGPGVAPRIDVQRESDRLIRLPEVQKLTGLRRSAIYDQMQRGVFPHSVKAGTRVAAWSEAAVQAWISDRIGASRGQRG